MRTFPWNRLARFEVLLPFAVAAVPLLVFGQALGFSFVLWDDDVNVTANASIKDLSVDSLSWMFTDAAYVQRYSPLSWLGWALLRSISGTDPVVFHAANVVLHACNAVLAYVVARRLLTLATGTSERQIAWAAAWAALAWAIHPLRAEAVSWVTGFRYLLAGCFTLGSVAFYLPTAQRAGRARSFWAAVGCFAASMFSYPIAAGLAVGFVALDAYPLKRFAEGLWSPGAKRAWLEKAPFLAAAGFVTAAAAISRFRGSSLYDPAAGFGAFGVTARLSQALYVWAYYLWKQLWPSKLTVVYTALVDFDPLSPTMVASGVLVIAVVAAAVGLCRRVPPLALATTLHLVMLVPALGLLEHPHFTSDRYSYLVGLAWPVLAAGAALALARKQPRSITAFAGGGALVLTLLAFLSFRQASTWRDTPTLFRHAIEVLGDDPYRQNLWWRLAGFYWSQGEKRMAVDCFTEALQIDPATTAVEDRIQALLESGRQQEAGEALREGVHTLQAAAREHPSASVHARLGTLLVLQRRWTEARAEYNEALRLDPEHAPGLYGVGRLQLRERDFVGAVRSLERALARNPKLKGAPHDLEVARREAARAP